MFNKGIKKLIGYWIAWVLTIWWASVVITNDDVADQYKANTWRELNIDESEFVSFEESLETEKNGRNQFQAMYDELNCNKTNDYNKCLLFKTSIKKIIEWLDGAIECKTRIVWKDNLEKSDISFCIDAEKELRDATKDFYISIDWSCGAECQETLDAYEYNVAMFQAYLKKAN